MSKTAVPLSRLEPGGDFVFTLTITNNSNASDPVTITSLTDTQSGATDFSDCEALVDEIIAPAGSLSCEYTVAHANAGVYNNRADVAGVDDEETLATATASASVEVFDVAPVINVTKTTDQLQVFAPGEDVIFTVVIVNNSVATDPVTITGLTDDIHGDLNGQGDCVVPQTIQPGSNYTCSFTVFVNGDETDIVTASGSDDEGTSVSDSDDATVDMINPSVAIEKSTNGYDADGTPGPEILAGAPVDWTYLVTNDGDVDLANVDVVDNQGVAVTCPQDVLAVGEFMACTASGVSEVGQYANLGTASATHTDVDGDSATRMASDPSHYWGATPSVEIVKTFADETVISGGAASSFTLVVTNSGNVALTNVLVDDSVDADLDITEVTVTTASTFGSEDCSASVGQNVSCTIPELAVGESVTITVEFDVDSTVPERLGVSNTGTASSGYIDASSNPLFVGDSSTDTIDILIDIDLSIVKAFDPTSLTQGETGIFTIVVSNAGPSDAVGVEITDTVHAGLEVTDVVVSEGSCLDTDGNPQTIECMADIPVGESVTVTVTYIAAPAVPAGDPIFDAALGITEGGDEFRIYFVNGSILEGSTSGGPVYLDGEDITDEVTLIEELGRNDIMLNPPADVPIPGTDDPAFLMHLSCSDRFIGGWGETDGPDSILDPNWQIASYSISRYNANGFIKSCGDTPVEFNILNLADAVGTDSFGPDDSTAVTSEDVWVEIVDPSLVFPEDDAVDFKNKDVWFKFVSKNPEDMVIAQIEIIWPEDGGNNGELRTIKLGKNTIWSGNEAGASVTNGLQAVIFEAAFSGSELDRTLEAFEKEKLRFTFENRPVTDPARIRYSFIVTFADGTDVSVQSHGTPESELP